MKIECDNVRWYRICSVSYTHLDVYKRQIEGITKKFLLLYVGPYTITRDKGNNTYEITHQMCIRDRLHSASPPQLWSTHFPFVVLVIQEETLYRVLGFHHDNIGRSEDYCHLVRNAVTLYHVLVLSLYVSDSHDKSLHYLKKKIV